MDAIDIEFAADVAHLAREVNTDEPVAIVILDTEGAPAQEIGVDLARALARRLNELAAEWEQQRRPLRRMRLVDDALREVDG